MKKILSALFLMIVLTAGFAYADNIQDVRSFFEKYVNAANTYQTDLPNFYAPNAKILRFVIQKDGTVYPTPLVVNTSDYMGQLKLNAKIAKLRSYKNYYKDIKIVPSGSNYKLSAYRSPSPSPNDRMPAYFIIGKNSSGNYVIKEEMMQTREQIFLGQIKKQQKN